MEELKLYKKQARKGYEKYFDLFLVWNYEGKVFECRIKPCFNNGLRSLLAVASPYPDNVDTRQ